MENYAIVEKNGRREMVQVENSAKKLVIFDGVGEDGKRKYREPKVHDYYERIGIIVFLGTKKQCEENLKS